MSMRHDIDVLKSRRRTKRKTFAEVQTVAEAYEQQGQYATAAVMWNVAEFLATTPEQKTLAKERRNQNIKPVTQ